MVTIRCFIAIELPPEIHQKLGLVIERLSQRKIGVRWVRAQNIHLTLKFLGEIPHSKVENVIRILKIEAQRFKPFNIQVEGLGIFPNARRPRVVWVGVKAPPDLSNLYMGIEAACKTIGFPPEGRDFSPHLTLGRVQQSATPDEVRRLSEVVENDTVGSLGGVSVEGLSLFRSDLKPGGAEYSLLFRTTQGQ